jgi:hypothetical protein
MRRTALAQGVFWFVTGLWPVVSLRSFEAITGPKRDKWLVKTTGALIGAVGISLIAGAFERRRSPVTRTLGVASAATLAAADVYFVSRGDIGAIYLGDAAVESAFIAGWLAGR